MERAEWLKQMRSKAEDLYDHLSPLDWVRFGLYANETHREYLQKFLGRVPPHSTLLYAACGAERYDGMLLEARHSVVGIDQSAGMLARARERFPGARYEKIGLQEMDFQEAFDGAICIDAMGGLALILLVGPRQPWQEHQRSPEFCRPFFSSSAHGGSNPRVSACSQNTRLIFNMILI